MQIDLQVPHWTVCGEIWDLYPRLPGKHLCPHGEGPQGTVCKDECGSYGVGVLGSASRDTEQAGHSPPCRQTAVW